MSKRKRKKKGHYRRRADKNALQSVPTSKKGHLPVRRRVSAEQVNSVANQFFGTRYYCVGDEKQKE